MTLETLDLWMQTHYQTGWLFAVMWYGYLLNRLFNYLFPPTKKELWGFWLTPNLLERRSDVCLLYLSKQYTIGLMVFNAYACLMMCCGMGLLCSDGNVIE